MTAPQLRPATPDDVPSIDALVAAAYGPWVAVIGAVPGPMRDDYRDAVADGVIQVIDGALGIAAMLILRPQRGAMLLENVAVHPDAQGQGLGKLLIGAAERATRALGFDRIILYTHAKMASNIALYERAGFAVVEERHEQGLDRIYMEKRLA